MKIYIAGPMRGVPEFNFPAFQAAAARLRAQGHVVFSPAEHDKKKWGAEFAKGNTDGDEQLAEKTYGFSLRDALASDTRWICLHADAVALLPGWQQSKGATAERALGIALNLEIMDLAP